MRTETVEIKIFSYDELSDDAKENVRQNFMSHGYDWSDDALQSLKDMAEHFGGRVSDYSIDWFGTTHSWARIDMPEMDKEDIQDLLNELGEYNPETLKGTGECKLTGYCADEWLIDAFRKDFFAGETDLNELMQSAFENWLTHCQSDCEYQFSDEAMKETCEANEYEFLENGEMY